MASIDGVGHPDGTRPGDGADVPVVAPAAGLPLGGAGLEDLLREVLQPRGRTSSPTSTGCDCCSTRWSSLAADLTLDGVLARIVEVARDLAGAKYAALGVLGHGTAPTAGCRRSSRTA